MGREEQLLWSRHFFRAFLRRWHLNSNPEGEKEQAMWLPGMWLTCWKSRVELALEPWRRLFSWSSLGSFLPSLPCPWTLLSTSGTSCGQAVDEACRSALGPLTKTAQSWRGATWWPPLLHLLSHLKGSLRTKPHLFPDQQDRVSETPPPRQLRG